MNPTTAYKLPFTVRFSEGNPLSSGGTVDIAARAAGNLTALHEVFDLFAKLAQNGFLAGHEIEPGKSGLTMTGQGGCYQCTNCRIDVGGLVVLVHLLLARQEEIQLTSLELAQQGSRATVQMQSDPEEMSSYPAFYHRLPFSFIDEEPESGAYTFCVELADELTPEHEKYLNEMFELWTQTVLTGGYGLAPIPPQESYVEPDGPLTSFGTSFEWVIFKLRADPMAVHGLINMLAAFHSRCQAITEVRIE